MLAQLLLILILCSALAYTLGRGWFIPLAAAFGITVGVLFVRQYGVENLTRLAYLAMFAPVGIAALASVRDNPVQSKKG